MGLDFHNVVHHVDADFFSTELHRENLIQPLIKMAYGFELPISEIGKGDMVETLHHGSQEVRWVGSYRRPAIGDLAPIVIREGVMGNHSDLRVSPEHLMLLEGWRVELLFGEYQAFVTAKDLVNGDSIYIDEGGEVEYFHMLFNSPEIVFANGAPSQAFLPGDLAMQSLAEEDCEEIFALLSDHRQGTRCHEAFHATLNSEEALILAENPSFLK